MEYTSSVQNKILREFSYPFCNVELLNQAITRKSYANENNCQHNERFEFLGDAILRVVAACYYFDNVGRGDSLSDNIDQFVQNNRLFNIASNMNLAKSIKMSSGEIRDFTSNKMTQKSILANCLEAIIGAIFLDSKKDYRFVEQAVATAWGINTSTFAQPRGNYLMPLDLGQPSLSKIEYEFNDVKIFYQAVTTAAHVNEQHSSKQKDNSNLKILGDCVLRMIVDDLLMEVNSNVTEGFLSSQRDTLLSISALSKIADNINLANFIKRGSGEAATNKLKSDCFKALVGSMFYDSNKSYIKIKECIKKTGIVRDDASIIENNYQNSQYESASNSSDEQYPYNTYEDSNYKQYPKCVSANNIRDEQYTDNDKYAYSNYKRNIKNAETKEEKSDTSTLGVAVGLFATAAVVAGGAMLYSSYIENQDRENARRERNRNSNMDREVIANTARVGNTEECTIS